MTYLGRTDLQSIESAIQQQRSRLLAEKRVSATLDAVVVWGALAVAGVLAVLTVVNLPRAS